MLNCLAVKRLTSKSISPNKPVLFGMSDDETPKNNIVKFPNKHSEDDYIIEETESNVHLPSVVDPKADHKSLLERIEYVKNQELVTALNSGATPDDIEMMVLQEIAEELSHQKYERKLAARAGKSTTNHSVARIASLRSLVEILNRRRANDRSDKLDFSSPRFQVVLKLWMEFVHNSMVKSGVSEEVIDLVFGQMKADMIDWERKVITMDESQKK